MSETGATSAVPLVVDLDGTLLHGDLLHESALRFLAGRPLQALHLVRWLGGGKANLKRCIAERVELDYETMPLHAELLAWIASERRSGRRIVLCSASDRKFVEGVARHVGQFDEVIASDGITNVSAHHKAAALEERFGAKGFDYVGNSSADVPVWRSARRAIVVGGSERLRRAAATVATVERSFEAPAGGVRAWLKAVRLHQWAKNLLVFIPLIASHRYTDLALLGPTVIAFFAFGLCASSVYLINDLIDIESDRAHPHKRLRPFAAGRLSALDGVGASVVCVILAFALASQVNVAFCQWLAVYFGLTLWYTFVLKRKILVDALALAGLYTLRILGGGAAASMWPGFWLLALSVFLFLSLAFVKRYAELQLLKMRGAETVRGRDYMTSDAPLVQSFGVTAGFAAVVVLALYMNGDTIVRLYPHQEVVWLTVPTLLYWVTRIWVKAHRGELHEDPVVFAMTDGLSLLTIGAFIAVLLIGSVRW